MDTFWKGTRFYLIVYSFLGFNQALQLCQNDVTTTLSTNLNMTSSKINGTNGMCSCKITFGGATKITMFANDIISPDCKTRLELSDTTYTFTCSNGKIPPASYVKDFVAGNTVWVFVTSTGSVNAMYGILQIKSKATDSQFTLQCFEPNSNTTSLPTTTTTTISTTTSTTTTTPPPPPQTTTTLVLPTTQMLVPPQQSSTTTIKTSSQQPQTTTEDPIGTTQSDVNTTSESGSNRSTTGSTPASSSGSSGVGASTNGDNKDFPVGAVVGGIVGGLAFIIIIILIAVCLRKRRKDPRLLESGPNNHKGHNNKGYDNGVPHIRDNMAKPSPHVVSMENDLYVSAGQQSDNAPRQNVLLENDNDMVEGSEVVVTSSGNIYAIVDKSNPERNQNIEPSGDVYASVNKPKKPNVTFNTDRDQSGGSDLYATVNKSIPDDDEEDEAAAISRMMQVPDEVLQGRISSVQSTAL